jgi:hypothetical protein
MSRHAVGFLQLKAIDNDRRLIEGWATRPETDRVGDIVESRGAQFKLPLPLLLDHVHSDAVGEVFDATVTDAGIRFKAKIAQIAEPGSLKDLCDTAWQAAKAGLRKAVSIGFRPLETEPIASGIRFKRWEWYELSMVSVPCLATATIDQVKAYDRDLRAKRAPVRVVRLDKPFAPSGNYKAAVVVKLGTTGLSNSAAPASVRDAVSRAIDDHEAQLEKARDTIKMGSTGMLASAIAATALSTDDELATLRARLDKLERGR